MNAEIKAESSEARKELLTRLRVRLKWCLGAYHLLELPELAEYPSFDGYALEDLRRWADSLIDGLRGGHWHEYFYLFTVARRAGPQNQIRWNAGTSMEAIVYEPDLSLFIEIYQITEDEAVSLLDKAVDLAVRHWLDARKEESHG